MLFHGFIFISMAFTFLTMIVGTTLVTNAHGNYKNINLNIFLAKEIQENPAYVQ